MILALGAAAATVTVGNPNSAMDKAKAKLWGFIFPPDTAGCVIYLNKSLASLMTAYLKQLI